MISDPPSSPRPDPAPDLPAPTSVQTWTDRQSSVLFRSGVIGTLVLLAYFAVVAQVEDPLHRYQGLTMIVLSLLPGLAWARRPDTAFPMFQTFMMTGLNSFAIPLLAGHEQLVRYPPESVSAAAWGVILFQVTALLAYRTVPGIPRTTRAWTTPLFEGRIEPHLRLGMTVTTLYTGVAAFTPCIPTEINSVLRAVCFGVGTLCTFLLSRSWGTGELHQRDRIAFTVLLTAQAVFLFSTLFLVGGLSLLVLALLGYVTGARRLPIVPCLLIFASMAVLHNGKSAMRLKYWENEAPRPGFTDLPAFYTEWIGYGLAPPETRTEDTLASRKLIERTSLLHMMTLVVDSTPSRQPFLDGETYGHILPQLIPRLFWPQKPLGHVSTHRLAVYYGLQDEESTLKTTIGFGVIVEAYANFGYTGLILLGCLIGASTRLAGVWTLHSPIISYPGLFMILLMAWSFQIELPMSAWISSLYQAALAVLGIPFVLRLIFR